MVTKGKCSCKVVHLEYGATEIEYCSLHEAAPELYEACKEVLEHLPDKEVEGSWDCENAKLLKQALAKVDGEL